MESPSPRSAAEIKLRLAGTDAEDVAIFSAILQDAVVLPGELRHDAANGQFGFIAQRYQWEARGITGCSRINCRITAFNVNGVEARGDVRVTVRPAAPALNLLALGLDEEAAALTISFAGASDLRLRLSPGWRLQLEDFGAPWPCAAPPLHRADKLD